MNCNRIDRRSFTNTPTEKISKRKQKKNSIRELEFIFPTHLEVIQKVKKIKSLIKPEKTYSLTPSPGLRNI